MCNCLHICQSHSNIKATCVPQTLWFTCTCNNAGNATFSLYKVCSIHFAVLRTKSFLWCLGKKKLHAIIILRFECIYYMFELWCMIFLINLLSSVVFLSIGSLVCESRDNHGHLCYWLLTLLTILLLDCMNVLYLYPINHVQWVHFVLLFNKKYCKCFLYKMYQNSHSLSVYPLSPLHY